MARTTPTLPLTPEEVTPKWLSSISGCKVKGFSFTKKTLNATASKLQCVLPILIPSRTLTA